MKTEEVKNVKVDVMKKSVAPVKVEAEPAVETEKEAEAEKNVKQVSDKKKTKKTVAKKKRTESVIIQYKDKEYMLDDILKKVKDSTKDAVDVKVYIKPEDDKAYYVTENGSSSVELD